MRGLIVVGRVPVHAEVGAPDPRAATHGCRQTLTSRVGGGETAEIACRARRARHEEAERWSRRRGGVLVLSAAREDQDDKEKWNACHVFPPCCPCYLMLRPGRHGC